MHREETLTLGKIVFAFGTIVLLASCSLLAGNGTSASQTQQKDTATTAQATAFRSFETSFESVSDFSGFYIVTQGDYDSNHSLSAEQLRDGGYSHKAWIVKARAANNDSAVYLPHRAYPTIQLHKTSGGVFRTPCLVSLWVYLDMQLTDRPAGQIDDWFSFATLSPDASDGWTRTIGVNIVHDGYVRLVHVPDQGKQEYIYQAAAPNDPDGKLLFPQRKWVRLDILISLDAQNGYAKVWQNGSLVSHALVRGGNGTLAQSHFGLYASAAIAAGTIFNDKLRIRETADEKEALALVGDNW
jgi:hypothetical protein